MNPVAHRLRVADVGAGLGNQGEGVPEEDHVQVDEEDGVVGARWPPGARRQMGTGMGWTHEVGGGDPRPTRTSDTCA